MPYRPAHFLPFLLGLTLLLAACAGDPADSALLPGACDGVPVGEPCGGGRVFASDYAGQGIVLVAAGENENAGATFQYKVDLTDTLNSRDQVHGTNNTGTFTSAHPASWQCQTSARNGFNDWYLPAIDELVLLDSVLGLPDVNYWSSTADQIDETLAVGYWPTGGIAITDKIATRQARCIRRP